MEVNILQSISETYQKLLDYKYRVVLGKKGKTEFATKKASDIFERCLNGDYMSSVYISQSIPFKDSSYYEL